jgi:hypothetical protein
MDWRVHVVRQGEHLESIAHRFGFDAGSVWNDSRNEALRAERPDPAQLAPGDRLHVPDGPPRGASCSARTANRYRGRVATVQVNVAFADEEGPLADQPYVVEGLPERVEGRTDASGRVSFAAPVSVSEVTLELVELQRIHPIRIGHLDPVATDGGVTQRLRHLGYLGAAVAGRPEPPPTAERRSRAIAAFQRDHDIEATGSLDDATRRRLVEVHGS